MTLCLTTFAKAEPAYLPRIVPICHIYTLPSGDEVCGYADVDEWKEVLEADAELVALRAILIEEKDRARILSEQKLLLEEKIKLHLHTNDLLSKRKIALTDELIKLDEKYQNERVKPRWGSPLAWGIASVSTAVLAGFLINSLLD